MHFQMLTCSLIRKNVIGIFSFVHIHQMFHFQCFFVVSKDNYFQCKLTKDLTNIMTDSGV